MTVYVLCPRHGGTHLTLSLVERLANERVVEVLKQPDQVRILPSDKVVISWRDPRNLIVSKLRHDLARFETRKKRTPYLRRHGVDAEILAAIRGDYGLKKRKIARDKAINFLMLFDTTRSAHHSVSARPYRLFLMRYLAAVAKQWARIDGFKMPFEEITNRKSGEQRADDLAEYLGSEGGAEQYAQIYGTGPTFNKTGSDWREWFGEAAMLSFKRRDGDRIVRMFGYNQ